MHMSTLHAILLLLIMQLCFTCLSCAPCAYTHSARIMIANVLQKPQLHCAVPLCSNAHSVIIWFTTQSLHHTTVLHGFCLSNTSIYTLACHTSKTHMLACHTSFHRKCLSMSTKKSACHASLNGFVWPAVLPCCTWKNVCLLAGSAGADSKVTKIFKRSGVGKVELDSASAGDVVSLAGASSAGIADTIGDAELVVPLSPGPIEPPTLRLDSTAQFICGRTLLYWKRFVVQKMHCCSSLNVCSEVREHAPLQLVVQSC